MYISVHYLNKPLIVYIKDNHGKKATYWYMVSRYDLYNSGENKQDFKTVTKAFKK